MLIIWNCAKWLIWVLRNSNLVLLFGFSKGLLNLNNNCIKGIQFCLWLGKDSFNIKTFDGKKRKDDIHIQKHPKFKSYRIWNF
jgi:hypothetical protein